MIGALILGFLAGIGGVLSAIIGTMIILPLFGFVMKRTGRVQKLEN